MWHLSSRHKTLSHFSQWYFSGKKSQNSTQADVPKSNRAINLDTEIRLVMRLWASPVVHGSASGNEKWPPSMMQMQNHVKFSFMILHNLWISYKMIGNFMKLWTSTGYFLNSFSSFVLVNFMKSQTTTTYLSNSSRSYVTSSFPQVSNLNWFFLKLIWIIYN
jgi:hypothetical protein